MYLQIFKPGKLPGGAIFNDIVIFNVSGVEEARELVSVVKKYQQTEQMKFEVKEEGVLIETL